MSRRRTLSPPLGRQHVSSKGGNFWSKPDPQTLIYEVVTAFDQDCPKFNLIEPKQLESLVLWCQEGDEVVVLLKNCLPKDLHVERVPPEVPLDRPDRPVSQQVSIHAGLVTYDVRSHDGANIGNNPPQTVRRGEVRMARAPLAISGWTASSTNGLL
jgi:hypothetical protein